MPPEARWHGLTTAEHVFNDGRVLLSDPSTHDARTRILAAAIELFGRSGYAATSVRSIASAADVSAPLVIHHFGDKEGLRKACDQRLLDYVEELAMPLLHGEDPTANLGEHDGAAIKKIISYMISVIREGGEVAQGLFTQLTELNLEVLERGVQAGYVRASDDQRARAALTVAYSLSEYLLGDLLAVSLDSEPQSPELAVRLSHQSAELFTHGMFADERLLNLFLHNTGSAGKDAASTTSAR